MTSHKKNVVVTGASSGIGFYTSIALAEKGHTVFSIARRKDKLQDLVDKSNHLKGKIIPISFDLSNFDKSKLSSFFNQTDSIDILINNAGLLLNKPFLEITQAEIEEVLQVNYIAVIKAIQFFHPFLIKTSQPHILNISSVGGVTGSVKFPGLSIYSSSKGALSILSECLAEDFKEDNVKVNCLALGSVNTEMLNKAFPNFESPTSPRDMANYISDFALEAHKVINGSTQIVSVSNP